MKTILYWRTYIFWKPTLNVCCDLWAYKLELEMLLNEMLETFVELLLSIYLFKPNHKKNKPLVLHIAMKESHNTKGFTYSLFSHRFVVLWLITLIRSLKEVIVWNCWLTRLQICKEIQFDSKDKLGGSETLLGGEMSNSRMGYSDFLT